MYRSTDGTQRYSCKHAETDPTVAEVSIRARIRGISCTCILSYNRASCTTPLGVTAREEEGGKIEKKRGKKEGKGAKRDRRDAERKRKKVRGRWWGSSRGDANLMAAAINNKHRSLIARESSFLSIFLHLPFRSSIPLLRDLSRFFESRLSCIFYLSLPPSRHRFPPFPREHRLPLSPFSESSSNRPRSFLLKRKV